MGPADETFAGAERALLQLATLLENTNAMCIAPFIPFCSGYNCFVSECLRTMAAYCVVTDWACAQLWALGLPSEHTRVCFPSAEC